MPRYRLAASALMVWTLMSWCLPSWSQDAPRPEREAPPPEAFRYAAETPEAYEARLRLEAEYAAQKRDAATAYAGCVRSRTTVAAATADSCDDSRAFLLSLLPQGIGEDLVSCITARSNADDRDANARCQAFRDARRPSVDGGPRWR